MNENEVETPIALFDLGDAVEETKQISPMQFVPDYMFGWGEFV